MKAMMKLLEICGALLLALTYGVVIATLGVVLSPFILIFLVFWPIARFWIYVKEGI